MQLLRANNLFPRLAHHERHRLLRPTRLVQAILCQGRMSSEQRGKRQQAIEEHLTSDAADKQVKKATSEKDDAADAIEKQGKQQSDAAEADETKRTIKNKAMEPAADDLEPHKPTRGKAGQLDESNTDDKEIDPSQTSKRDKVENNEGTSGAKSDNLPENTLEQGRVFFMYKPRVTGPGEEPSISGLDDIQRTYLLLQPDQPSGGKSRLLVLPKKKLPDPGRHEKFFAFVEAVAGSPSELTSGLQEEHYSTKTRGERVQPAARAVGEGPYVIAKGGKRGGVHWGYKLEVPQEPGEAQRVLGIRGEGSYVISAKNPNQKGRAGVPSAGPEPEYTPEQREQFSNRSWIGVEDPSLLDVAGTELLLVGAKADPIEAGELGEAGDLLQQVSDKNEDLLQQLQQQEQLLKEALEPEPAEAKGKRGRGGSSDAAEGQKKKSKAIDDVQKAHIPVEPAITGKLE